MPFQHLPPDDGTVDVAGGVDADAFRTRMIRRR
jgi:hypothetical protein